MIASWMIYIVLVSASVSFAAVLVENVLRATGTPTRLLWVAGICFPVIAAIASARLPTDAEGRSFLLPGRDLPGGQTGDVQVTDSRARFIPQPPSIAVSPNSRLASLDSTLLALWMTGCLLTLGVFGGAAVRLRRIRTAAEVRDVDGVRVSITPNTGPLVVGVMHPQILIPRWVLELDHPERQLVVAHEQEHLRAHDPALLAFSALAAGLTPWNPFVWYMLRKLGQAIELDCDRRVLAQGPDPRAYAHLLLSVASRSQTNLIPLAGLAATTSSLEQRFRSMTQKPMRNRGYHVISVFATVLLLLVGTAMIPRPIRGTQLRASLTPGQSGAQATGRVKVVSASEVSTFKIYATGGAFARGGERPRARTDTITGSVFDITSPGDVFNIDVTNGEVHFVSDDSSSIHIEAAMSGASPALWLAATGRHVIIQRGGGGLITDETVAQSARPDTTDFFEFQVDQPVVLRESVKPAYPAALKSSGISGDVWVQFVVDETGRVDMRTFKLLSSPHPLLTAAVKEVLPKWRLDSAIRHEKRVRQVVQQAFQFGPSP
jgi:TonB family protein